MSIIVLNLPPPTLSDGEAIMHIFEASFGIGVLSMPLAFSRAGLVGGVLGIIMTGIICTHCASILVTCARILYQRTGKTPVTIPQIAKSAFENGPVCCRPFAKLVKYSVLNCLFLSYFGASAAYTVIVAKNVEQLVDHYAGVNIDLRIILVALVLPFMLMSWIPNMRWLRKVTFVANICMLIGLVILVNYLINDLPLVAERPLFGPVSTLPSFFSIVIFAFEAIGVIMPLQPENQTQVTDQTVTRFGMMAQGLSMILLVYIVVGFLGYAKYGEMTRGSITLNLPSKHLPTHAVKIFITISVYGTFGLQFSVCLGIAWKCLLLWCPCSSTMANFSLRTMLVTVTILLGVALPRIPPFIGLLGSLCFTLLGVIAPVCIETVTYWQDGFGKFHWRAFKNIFICMFGLMAFVFGSMSAVDEIVELHKEIIKYR